MPIKKYDITKAKSIFKSFDLNLIENAYKNIDEKMNYICLNCNFTGKKSLYDVIKFKSGCKNCNLNRLYKSKKYSIEYAQKCFLNNNLELLDSEYIDNQTPMSFKCIICGSYGQNNLSNVKNKNQGCKKCKDEKSASKKRIGIELSKEIFFQNNLELLDNNYINSKTKMKYKCLVCNYLGEKSLNSIQSKKYGCLKCYEKNRSGENHWNWNPDKKDLNQKIRIKRSNSWIEKNMKDDPLYEKWKNRKPKEYEIHHTPQINDWCSYLIENKLENNEEFIMKIREIANERKRLSIIPTKTHKNIHKNNKYKFNKIKFENFLLENNIKELLNAN